MHRVMRNTQLLSYASSNFHNAHQPHHATPALHTRQLLNAKPHKFRVARHATSALRAMQLPRCAPCNFRVACHATSALHAMQLPRCVPCDCPIVCYSSPCCTLRNYRITRHATFMLCATPFVAHHATLLLRTTKLPRFLLFF